MLYNSYNTASTEVLHQIFKYKEETRPLISPSSLRGTIMSFYSGWIHYVSKQQQQVLSNLPFPKAVIAGDCDRIFSFNNSISIGKALSIIYLYLYLDVEPYILKNQGHGLHNTAGKECWEIMKNTINEGENNKNNYELKKSFHKTTCIIYYYYIIYMCVRC